MRPLEKIVFAQPIIPTPDVGNPSRFEWIALDKLVVDPRYQRDINERGRKNIRHIISNFRWSRFSPVVVAPLADGRFAIIDGQHRATAALMHGGTTEIPCMIIDADQAEQARAFSVINGQVTSMQQTQIFHARVTGEDPGAVALFDLCEDCGVVILKQPVSRDHRKGETLAIGTLQKCYSIYGAEILHLALKLIVETGDGNAGWLRAPIIKGVAATLYERPDLVEAGAALFTAFDSLPMRKVSAEAGQKRLDAGGAEWSWVQKIVTAHLDRRLERAAA